MHLQRKWIIEADVALSAILSCWIETLGPAVLVRLDVTV